ncbi:MAG TPA: hypothetical protein VF015_12815, partial [Acidimicrobiales bacterium]
MAGRALSGLAWLARLARLLRLLGRGLLLRRGLAPLPGLARLLCRRLLLRRGLSPLAGLTRLLRRGLRRTVGRVGLLAGLAPLLLRGSTPRGAGLAPAARLALVPLGLVVARDVLVLPAAAEVEA